MVVISSRNSKVTAGRRAKNAGKRTAPKKGRKSAKKSTKKRVTTDDLWAKFERSNSVEKQTIDWDCSFGSFRASETLKTQLPTAFIAEPVSHKDDIDVDAVVAATTQELDALARGPSTASTTSQTSESTQTDEEPMPAPTLSSLDSDENIENVKPPMNHSTSIPKMSPRRPLSPIAAPQPEHSPATPSKMSTERRKGLVMKTPIRERLVEAGDRVRICRGAQKKFAGKMATVERYLPGKRKWGLKLDNGSRICLGEKCLKVVEKAGAPKSAKSTKVTLTPPPTPHKQTMTRQRSKSTGSSHLSPHEDSAPTMSEIGEKRSQRFRKSIRHALKELQPKKKHALEVVEFDRSATVKPASKDEIQEYVQRLSLNSLHKRAMGEPLLHQAARGGRSDILMALVMGGKCNLNADNGAFQTALHVAVDTDNTECALLLLEMGADHLHADAEGETVLMCAAKRGNLQIVSALIQSGANINFRSHHGLTALMHACVAGQEDVITMLVRQGADVERVDERGQSAMLLAMKNGQTKAAECLMQLIYSVSRKSIDIDAENDESLHGILRAHSNRSDRVDSFQNRTRADGSSHSLPDWARGL